MKKIECILRPYKLEEVKNALTELGVLGMTVTDVRGVGSSADAEQPAGLEYVIRLPVRVRLEMVVPDEMAEPVVETILRHAQTGQPDDGKIFIYPLQDAMRVRTEERGEEAIS